MSCCVEQLCPAPMAGWVALELAQQAGDSPGHALGTPVLGGSAGLILLFQAARAG